MTATATTVLISAVVVLGVVWLAILSATRASRLNRLHIRVDLARQALFGALERRAVVARAIAAAEPEATGADALLSAADSAESAAPAAREVAENLLSAAIAHTDPANRSAALTSELAEAQTRVTMARRFYNDAVRDARSLRGRRMVRWLHLAGHALQPDYFEITERVTRG
ncbi:LemA family protein [Gordonia sp. HY002]|uniref:LemA family protein n=1 Tax=Gordonia zhenghanii TaxID=2911516 RepID=UPI001EEFB88C|nr:LemA family protein [Gordonia zhenghanii]MCF8569717.1 LemA family protein [Gordonia zhenghanii]MCF8603249.1 LemA family protein [Gordonia zhenghanii]